MRDFAHVVDRVRHMDSSHEAPAPSRGGRQEETNSNKQHREAVSADDGGAKKRRRVDISHAASGGGGGPSGGGSIAAAESQQQQEGGATSLSADLTTPIQHPQQQQQQHPVWYVCAHRGNDFLLRDVLQLRKTCCWARGLFGAPQLRQRLNHELSTQAGLRRTANGQQLLTFDEQQMGEGDLLAALCVTEAGGWSEMSEAVELAGQCSNCQLPVRLTPADLHQYPNKTAYLAAPRVLAQLKMVGPHIHLGDGVTFQLFQHGNTLRAVKDEDGFEIDINPPIPAYHLFQQHRQQHDPPVRSRIYYSRPTNWLLLSAYDYASVSSCVKKIVLDTHFVQTPQINRRVDNGRPDTITTQSPHTPVAGCTTTASFRFTDSHLTWRDLVLTDAGHSFVARIAVTDLLHNNVRVLISTTESAVSGVGGAFKDRFPETTRLARVVLGASIAQRIFER
ncbi:unnamed protein product [Vitrella brassicaformis CCMP3155]|uniref:Uncharacterized protein n=1 Tax=Vitrella brassicaformis (strain CCMP3155) TaxID=1169540 RepID=A0A0G4ERR6_VITBC|nr:unnamed protein product [Vitrella brassicaformis CCMP3155]|eukprot:CEM00739.1 unnamed protein product [Vitrella brassicaformis CCMP3155]